MEEKIILNSLVYLSIGSNLGDRLLNIQNAVSLIRDNIGEIKNVSPIYENPPLGFDANTLFYNACIVVETKLSPMEVLEQTQIIEQEIGRTKKTVGNLYSSRIIDIDIILFENEIINEEMLKIPHPLFTSRKFVLLPLNDISKDIIDPLSGLTVSQLLAVCKDKSPLLIVKKTIL